MLLKNAYVQRKIFCISILDTEPCMRNTIEKYTLLALVSSINHVYIIILTADN